MLSSKFYLLRLLSQYMSSLFLTNTQIAPQKKVLVTRHCYKDRNIVHFEKKKKCGSVYGITAYIACTVKFLRNRSLKLWTDQILNHKTSLYTGCFIHSMCAESSLSRLLRQNRCEPLMQSYRIRARVLLETPCIDFNRDFIYLFFSQLLLYTVFRNENESLQLIFFFFFVLLPKRFPAWPPSTTISQCTTRRR